MLIHEVAIRATTYGKPPATFRARVADLDARDRRQRCVRAFLPMFGVACVLLFIPPHVLTFLTCVVIASTMARRRHRETRLFQSLSGACPECGTEQDFAPPDRLPHLLRCASCRAFIRLELA
jgi:hypothetical protein